MIDVNKLFQIVGDRDVRYSVIRDYSNDMSVVLGKFGLISNKSLLMQISREEALEILKNTLWKDLAYSSVERMAEDQAVTFAQQLFAEHDNTGSCYFSNHVTRYGPNAIAKSQLTESTFDSGIIISNETTHRHFCMWFEDED